MQVALQRQRVARARGARQQLAGSGREHAAQRAPSLRWSGREVASPWSGSSDADLDLLGSDGQRAPDLAPRTAAGPEGPRSGFFFVSLLFPPENLVSYAKPTVSALRFLR